MKPVSGWFVRVGLNSILTLWEAWQDKNHKHCLGSFSDVLFGVGKNPVTDILLHCCIITQSHLFKMMYSHYFFKANSVFFQKPVAHMSTNCLFLFVTDTHTHVHTSVTSMYSISLSCPVTEGTRVQRSNMERWSFQNSPPPPTPTHTHTRLHISFFSCLEGIRK